MAIGSQVLYTAEEFAGSRILAIRKNSFEEGSSRCLCRAADMVKSALMRRIRWGGFSKIMTSGRFLTNDSGVINERGPDTVRGEDVSFYSYQRVPKGPLPRGYLDVPPDLVCEVLSPDDRWRKVLGKVAEYLDAGVQVVVVLDPERRMIHVFTDDEPTRILTDRDELTIPGLLGDFRVPVHRLFD